MTKWYSAENQPLDIPTFQDLQNVTGQVFDNAGIYIGPAELPKQQLVIDNTTKRQYYAPKEYSDSAIKYAEAKRNEMFKPEDWYGMEMIKPHYTMGEQVIGGLAATGKGVTGLLAQLPTKIVYTGAVFANELSKAYAKNNLTDIAKMKNGMLVEQENLYRMSMKNWEKTLQKYGLINEPEIQQMAGGRIGSMIGDVGGSLLTAALVSSVGGLPAVAAVFGSTQFADVMEEGLSKGLSHDKAFAAAWKAALSEGGLEAVGFKLWSGAASLNKSFRNLMLGFAWEGAQEGSQQIAESVITNYYGIREQTFMEIMSDVVLSALVGGLVGFVGAGISGQVEQRNIALKKDIGMTEEGRIVTPSKDQLKEGVVLQPSKEAEKDFIAQEIAEAKKTGDNKLYNVVKNVANAKGITDVNVIDKLYPIARKAVSDGATLESMLDILANQVVAYQNQLENGQTDTKATQKAVEEIKLVTDPNRKDEWMESRKSELEKAGFTKEQAGVLSEHISSAVQRLSQRLGFDITKKKELSFEPNLSEKAGTRGQITLGKTLAKIALNKNADPTTVEHEFFHYIDSVVKDAAKEGNSEAKKLLKKREEIIKNAKAELKKSGVKEMPIDEEILAQAYEKWLWQGAKSEDATEQKLFEAIREFFREVYDTVKGLVGIRITPEMDAYFKTMTGESTRTLYQFAGPMAETADRLQLSKAEQMLSEGKEAEEIRKETGWFKGVDGKWRFEISDKDAKLKVDIKPFSKEDIYELNKNFHIMTASTEEKGFLFGEKERNLAREKNIEIYKKNGLSQRSYELSDLLSHEKLFKAYPLLKSIYVRFETNLGVSGSYSDGVIKLDIQNNNTPQELKKTLLHEIQHAIQEKENFAIGGNPADYEVYSSKIDEIEEERVALAKKIKEMEETGGEARYGSELSSAYSKALELNREIQRLRQKDEMESFNRYMALAGEIEARNVEARYEMSEEERLSASPESTQDIKNADAIVVFDDGTEVVYGKATDTLFQEGIKYDKNGKADINSPEFKKWFGNSKVVDENGKPLVVYHGTTRGGFAEFEQNEIGSNTGNATSGFFFTDHQMAQTYSNSKREIIESDSAENEYGEREDVSGLYPVYLSIKNPEVFDFQGASFDGLAYGRYAINDDENSDLIRQENGQVVLFDSEQEATEYLNAHDIKGTVLADPRIYESTQEVVGLAKDLGADGVIIKNVQDEGRYGRGYNVGDVYVAFEPNQIKSVYNRGTFDTESPNIYYQGESKRISGLSKLREEYQKELSKDYRFEHKAPIGRRMEAAERLAKGYALNLKEVLEGFSPQPADYFSENGPRLYGYDTTEGKESLEAINKIKNGGKRITIYRAVPQNVNSINEGDWVTFSKEYAKNHGEKVLDGKYKILKKNVAPNEVWWDGNDINEWGYSTESSYQDYGSTLYQQEQTNDQIFRNNQALKEGQKVLDKAPTNAEVEKEMEAIKSGKVAEIELSKRGWGVGEFFGDILLTVRQRVGVIDKRLKYAFDRLDFNEKMRENTYGKQVVGFIRKYRKLSDVQKAELNYLLSNRLDTRVREFLRQNDMLDEYTQARTLLDNLYVEGNKAGMDMGFLQEYFPTKVADPKGFISYLMGTDKWTEIERALHQIDPDNQMSDEDKANAINNILRGYNRIDPITKQGFQNERVIFHKTPEMMKFYAPADEALMRYISGMSSALSIRSAFNVKGAFNSEESIGGVVNELIKSGQITYKEEDFIKKMLRARLNYARTAPIVSLLKNFGYLGTMNNITSAVTQIGDLYASFYKYNFPTAMKAIFGKSEITKEDLHIDSIWEEFSKDNLSGVAVDKLFSAIGLNAFDKFGKNTAINGAWKNLKERAKNNDISLLEDLTAAFGSRAGTVMKDIKNNNITEDIKLLLWSQLADTQPIGKSGVPVGYLNNPNGRILYQLKTYTINQLSLFYADGIYKIQKGIATKNKKLFLQGIGNTAKLALLLTAFNAGADVLKNLIMGRSVDISDTLLSNMLWNIGVSKYTFYRGQRDGYARALLENFLMPPQISMGDDAYMDVKKIATGKRKPSDTIAVTYVPFGRMWYWWFGGGRTQEKKKGNKPFKVEL